MVLASIFGLITLQNVLIGGFTIVIFGFSSVFLLSALFPWPKRRRRDFLQPVKSYNGEGEAGETLPNLLRDDPKRPTFTESTVYLSVVVPAMNEQERLPKMLDECFDYLHEREKQDSSFSFEVLVVDDGSTDSTSDIAIEYGRKHGGGKLKVLKLEQNRGKGGAIRQGVMHSSGKLILFADADGATKFSDVEKLEKGLLRISGGPPMDESFPAVAVGSRAHMEAEAIATRSFFRTILMHGFHVLVWLFSSRTVRDTQCGFKLFTRASAAQIFPVLHVERWAFDVELIYLCELWRIPILEVSVTWHEVEGSKLVPFWSWLQMGRDLILIWFRYRVGIWTDTLDE
ncbi:hypothetical protein KIN20_036867 [Parelaphostrongylus tenuis]|uniref:Dolichyl-phosphate beta-glucosyltransferase n=1 Tax=Parelaphostrongylus tenuis TaxID=148309 RepID=A0AAD5RD60_PARTN|nr:hypothetical protein KIN20_036867 [Parelaphostrongylus tenuis]